MMIIPWVVTKHYAWDLPKKNCEEIKKYTSRIFHECFSNAQIMGIHKPYPKGEDHFNKH